MCDGSHGWYADRARGRAPTSRRRPPRHRRASAKTKGELSPGQDRQSARPGDRHARRSPYVRPTVATIDLNAGKGRTGLPVGGRVRISGTGLYAGEIAVIEKLVTGVIPQAVVRTEAGKTRQVRTIDLEPVGPASAAGRHRAGRPRPTPPPAE